MAECFSSESSSESEIVSVRKEVYWETMGVDEKQDLEDDSVTETEHCINQLCHINDNVTPEQKNDNHHLNDFSSTTKSLITTDQGTSNWEKVRQEVTCAICLELLDDPKSMPCLHTYCKKCLMEALTKRPHDPDLPRDRPAINCPLCRAEVDLSHQGIEALPSNFSASRLVETVQLQDKLNENKRPKCDGCMEKDAIASCCDCGGFFLCSVCSKAHKNVPATKNHTIRCLDEFLQSKIPPSNVKNSPLCKKHPQEMLKLYCQNCEILVCRDCALVTHRSHDYNFVDDVVEDEKKKLKDVTLKKLETILKSTKIAIFAVEQMQSKVLSNNDVSVAIVTDAFQEIIDMVNARKKAVLEETQQMTQDDLCPLQKQQDDLTMLKQKIEGCRDFTRDTLRNGTNSEVMSARKQMLERTKILSDLHNSSSLSPAAAPSSVPFCLLDSVKEEIKQVGTFVSLHHCSIGEIPKCVEKSETITLKVIVKDTKGQRISKAKDLITAKVTTGDLHGGQVVPIDELGDGEYSLTFVPQNSGKHVIHAQIKDTHISNSPCHVEVCDEKVMTTVYTSISKVYGETDSIESIEWDKKSDIILECPTLSHPIEQECYHQIGDVPWTTDSTRLHPNFISTSTATTGAQTYGKVELIPNPSIATTFSTTGTYDAPMYHYSTPLGPPLLSKPLPAATVSPSNYLIGSPMLHATDVPMLNYNRHPTHIQPSTATTKLASYDSVSVASPAKSNTRHGSRKKKY